MVGRKAATIYLEYQNYIDQSPVHPSALYGQACASDQVTIQAWRETWISQVRANHAIYGPFKDRSVAKIYNKFQHKPVFLLGAGPSLAKNAHQLVGKHGIPIISCLHNFHFLEDLGVKVDYYVSLDSGPITIDELSEGGNPETDYWAKSKGKTLLCYTGTHPNLLAKWQGEFLFFNCPLPDQSVEAEIDAIERFKIYVSSGGNVLGASTYIAKGILGCSTTIFLGADFSFSYEEKFHGWDSKYDSKLGQVIRLTDIYGNKTKTWQSYANFKAWFDWVAQCVPGEYINATEGGIFGSYNEGNIRAVTQMDLDAVLQRYGMSEKLRECVENPETTQIQLLF